MALWTLQSKVNLRLLYSDQKFFSGGSSTISWHSAFDCLSTSRFIIIVGLRENKPWRYHTHKDDRRSQNPPRCVCGRTTAFPPPGTAVHLEVFACLPNGRLKSLSPQLIADFRIDYFFRAGLTCLNFLLCQCWATRARYPVSTYPWLLGRRKSAQQIATILFIQAGWGVRIHSNCDGT